MENFRLKMFRTVATYLNFSRAAEELLLTQPAVTQQIKALEPMCSKKSTRDVRIVRMGAEPIIIRRPRGQTYIE